VKFVDADEINGQVDLICRGGDLIYS